MARRKRQFGLSVFVQLYGTHANAWRRPGVKAAGNPDFADWAAFVQLMERGRFDFAFFADFVGNGGTYVGNGRRPRGRNFEPLTLVAALATVTRHIGLVATVNTNFNDPYNLARRLASLDHLSGGRVGWNVVSSLAPEAAKTFGIATSHHHRHADRHRRPARRMVPGGGRRRLQHEARCSAGLARRFHRSRRAAAAATRDFPHRIRRADAARQSEPLLSCQPEYDPARGGVSNSSRRYKIYKDDIFTYLQSCAIIEKIE